MMWIVATIVLIAAASSLLLYYLWSTRTRVRERFSSTAMMDFDNPNVRVGRSRVGDRGAFATRFMRKGEIVERCPALIDERSNIKTGSVIDDYVFGAGEGSKVAIALGYCSTFNHSDRPNVAWRVDVDGSQVVLEAVRDISAGEELFLSYGPDYWTSRGKRPV